MKKLLCLVIAALLMVAAAPRETPADTPIKGAWKMVRYQYDTDPMKTLAENDISHKIFTGSRWSAAGYDKLTKKIVGSAGGTYTIKGSQYFETVEYYSWDSEVCGKTFTFTMTIENGMLHQKGTMEWKDNPKYIIDEWYVRVD